MKRDTAVGGRSGPQPGRGGKLAAGVSVWWRLAPRGEWDDVVFAAAAGAVVFVTCSNSLSSPFLLDDLSKVRDNPDIRSLSPAALVYPYADNAAQNVRRNDPSRPLVFLSYALNYVLLGPSPWHFRAVNVLVHVCNAWQLRRFLCEVAGCCAWPNHHRWVEWGCILWACAPLSVGTATYVYGRADVFAAFFTLRCLCSHLGAARAHAATPRAGSAGTVWLGAALRAEAAAAAWQGAALASKQTALAVPMLRAGLTWLLHRAHSRGTSADARAGWGGVLLSCVLGGLLLALRWVVLGARSGGFDLEAQPGPGGQVVWGMGAYLSAQPLAVVRYAQLALLPCGMALDHALDPRALQREPVRFIVAPAVVLVAGSLLALLLARRASSHRADAFIAAWGWFLVSLAPSSSFVPTTDCFAERRAYFAAIAPLLALPALLLLSPRQQDRLLGERHAILAAIAAAYIAFSRERNAVASDPARAWNEVVERYPDHTRGWNNLGVALRERGDALGAIRAFEAALGVDAGEVVALSNLGMLLADSSLPFADQEQATQLLRRAAELDPRLASPRYNLGLLAHRASQASRRKWEADARNDGRSEQTMGPVEARLLQEAMRHYLAALVADPKHVDARSNLGLVYFREGRLDEAQQIWWEALALTPQHPPLLHNIAMHEALNPHTKPRGGNVE